MSLIIHLFGEPCGRLSHEGGAFVFTYFDEWGQNTAIKYLSVHLRETRNEGPHVAAYFANLLPESHIKAAIAAGLGVSQTQLLELLLGVGGECMGAVSCHDKPVSLPYGSNGYKPFSLQDLIEFIRAQPYTPLTQFKEGLRLILPGAQNKIPLYRSPQNELFLPERSSVSNGILKVRIPGYPNSTINEYFCMKLARQIGLSVPDVELFQEGLGLWISRYDRHEEAGIVVADHQEDMCQVLGIMPDHKYETDGGPGIVDCLKVITQTSNQQAIDIKALLTWLIFNICIGNHTAHGKNIALLHSEQGGKQVQRLAPFYNMLSTVVYDNLEQRLAMGVAGDHNIDQIGPVHMITLAKQCDVSPRLMASIIHDTTDKLLAATPALASKVKQWDVACISTIEAHIMQQARRLSAWGGLEFR